MAKITDKGNQLSGLLLLSSGVFLLATVLTVVLMKDTTYQLTLGHLAKDALASQNGSTVLAPAARSIWELPLRYVVAAVLAVSALYTGLLATRWSRRYDQGVKDGVRAGRWIYLGITSVVMIEITAILSGINDIMYLKLIGSLVATSALLAWLNERYNKNTKKPDQLTYYLSLATHILAWLPIIASAVATTVYGMERLGWHVYALYAVLIGSFLLLAVNQRRYYRRAGQWKDYTFVERNYLKMDLVTKALFTLVLILGFKK